MPDERKIPFITPGAMWPISDGPRSMPAAISPTTSGWRIRRHAAPSNFAAASTTAICRNSNFSSGIAGFQLAVGRQTLPAFVLAVLHAEIPIEEAHGQQDAIEG
jgi:hypothetical protein